MRRRRAGAPRLPILVFAKPPRPGRAKTRLAPALGAVGAADLAGAFFADTWRRIESLPWARPVLVTTDPAAPEWRTARPGRIWMQSGGDLGARLEVALRHALDGGAPGVLAVGSDSPGLPAALLRAARDALESNDAVLGPTKDGGFYLLGLRRCPPGLLAGLPWSCGETRARTRERLLERGLSLRELDPWFDVDRPADLAILRRRIDRGSIHAPATLRALARRAPGTPRISVVVPVLDEAERIAAQLRRLTARRAWHEILVVDGGSRDATIELARAVAGITVLAARRGRAAQMNCGARAATGDVVLFLHADVELPDDAPERIGAALADSAVAGGAFRTWTVADSRRSRLAPWLHLADLRSRYSSLPYGDQAIFVRADVFARLGGFPELALMEDLAFARRLRRAGEIRIVSSSVRVSGRRFLARPIYYFLLVNLMPLLYALGVPPARLARLYGNPR